ncbi:hypothetical protein [Pyrobaculum aerophilum]|uniref:Uncharacterized protein n=1 Tax=Pyrobaculum aerophilum TaxID=13773 RepID=A0A371QZU1_9CREN|nr:hypothetical protein [Pyrobaculum aerophilum]RFA96351.1 hypothetical protein CGL51_05200 [Pyrobaculum aerophilum]RFA96640.1 hypothetical protein CGL52_10880 [Pyrobaculum aerophilum]
MSGGYYASPRIHGSKALLARLRYLLAAALISRFVAESRDALDLLEESYAMARSGAASYGKRRGVRGDRQEGARDA